MSTRCSAASSIPGGNWLNEATADLAAIELEPASRENLTDVGLDYQGVIRIGGRDTTQEFVQQRLSLRDDYTRFIDVERVAQREGGRRS